MREKTRMPKPTIRVINCRRGGQGRRKVFSELQAAVVTARGGEAGH